MPLFFQQDICSPVAFIERELFNFGILQDSLAPDQVTQNIDNLTRLLNYFEDATSWEDTLAGLDADTSQKFQEFKDSDINPLNHSVFPAEDEEDYPYSSPPNSPTNKEMHAYNGNLAQAQSFVEPRHSHHLLRSIRTAASHIPNPLRSIAQGIRQRFPRETPLHSYLRGTTLSGDAGDLRFASMMNQPIGMLAGGAYVAGKEAIDTVKDISKEYSHNSISNKQAHIDNGNVESEHQHQKRHTKPFPKPTTWDGVLPEQHNVDTANISTGPTNAEMHSYNGNIDPFSAMSKMADVAKKHLRKKKTKPKNQRRRPYYRRPRRKWVRKQAVAKSLPKGVKAAAKIEKREAVVARQYMRFLKNPCYRAPRLGSTGNSPTLLVHGYYKALYNMQAPFGVGVTNATCCTAALNPKLFYSNISSNGSVAPILVSFTTDGNIAPTIANATGDYRFTSFTNDTNLKTSLFNGTTVNAAPPLGRFLGGSISLECRCPMATVSPPYLFGGLLPAYPSQNNNNEDLIDTGLQMNTFTPHWVRQNPFSVDVPGFSVSSVYQPGSATHLNFDNTTTMWSDSSANQKTTPIPYVGMVGCPTTATVTIIVSAWFEIQVKVSSTFTTAANPGYALGPRISTEDVFDFIKPFNGVSNRTIDTGARANIEDFNRDIFMMQQKISPSPPTLSEELQELKQAFRELKLQIESEEDEKYFDCENTPTLDKHVDTPIYRGLSKSTIDLAINLKKSLTPGSVTNKTIQTNSQ